MKVHYNLLLQTGSFTEQHKYLCLYYHTYTNEKAYIIIISSSSNNKAIIIIILLLINNVNTYTTEKIQYEHLCINYGNQYIFSKRVAIQGNNVFI